MLVWILIFLVAAGLFYFSAPPGFRFTLVGMGWALLLPAGCIGVSMVHLGFLEKFLRGRSLGPEVYRPITRFPQATSMLTLYLGACLSGIAYLWMKLYLKQSIWISGATMGMFFVMCMMGSIAHYFVAKQNLMRVFKALAGQPGFDESYARFRASLRSKFGFGVLGVMMGVLLLSILVSGLTVQASIRTKVASYAGNELANLADSVSFVQEMNPTPEDLTAFLGTLKLGAGGGISLKLPASKGGRTLGSQIQPEGAADILVVHALPGGSELRAVIPEREYADAIWKALRPNIVLL
ncbi:MAG TPA: hypothetical protein VF768_03930, partial [Holophagaceae bacterium]